MNDQIRVLLVDDHIVVRTGVKLLIESHAGLVVVGEAGTTSEAIVMARYKQPDIILIEIITENGDDLDYITELAATPNQPRLLVLTGNENQDLHIRAIHLGAMGLVSKKKDPDTLIKAIEKVHSGEVWLDRSTIAKVLSQRSIPSNGEKSSEMVKINSLTKRERDIITLVAQGLKNKQTASRLAISDITVRHHLTSIFSKLDLTDRFELIIYAYKHGLCDLPDSGERARNGTGN
jgi:DNA-binding NarL/FixJ family response regulator